MQQGAWQGVCSRTRGSMRQVRDGVECMHAVRWPGTHTHAWPQMWPSFEGGVGWGGRWRTGACARPARGARACCATLPLHALAHTRTHTPPHQVLPARCPRSSSCSARWAPGGSGPTPRAAGTRWSWPWRRCRTGRSAAQSQRSRSGLRRGWGDANKRVGVSGPWHALQRTHTRMLLSHH